MQLALTFDIRSEAERLAAKNLFDGNLVFGAKRFHESTKRTGAAGPSTGSMVREQALVVEDTGVDRYRRKEGYWEPVEQCPVCGSPEREFLLSRYALDIWRCGGCTHRYMNPRITFAAIERLYADDQLASTIYTSAAQKQIDEVKYTYGLEVIEQLGPPARERLLDFGCGAGLFPTLAHRRGWRTCVGIDINENFAPIYREATGVQFINSSFERLEPGRLGGGYDCIAMWNVLEHLYDLHGIIAALKRMMKPGALFFVMVPNAGSLATRLIRERSPTFNWKHVSHFTAHSLSRLFAAHGFEAAHAETAITEIDNVKSYMSGEHPYYGHGDPEGLFEWITPEWIHRNMLGSRLLCVFRNA